MKQVTCRKKRINTIKLETQSNSHSCFYSIEYSVTQIRFDLIWWEKVRTTKIRTSKTKKNSENHANHHNVEKRIFRTSKRVDHYYKNHNIKKNVESQKTTFDVVMSGGELLELRLLDTQLLHTFCRKTTARHKNYQLLESS